MQYPSLSDALSCVRSYGYKAASTLTAGVLAAGLLLSTSLAQAATVLANGSQAYRIENLEVTSGGSLVGLFNVDFLWTSAESIYGSSIPDFDFPNQASSEAARDAVIAALNDYNDEQVITEDKVVTTGPQDLSSIPNFFKIGFAWNSGQPTNIETVDGIYNVPSELWISDGVDAINTIDGTTSYAKFSVVPVPAAVWLFGSGLLGLIGIARSKQATSV